MKTILRISISILLIFILSLGCDKDKIVEQKPETVYTLDLINPVEIIQPYCCIEFKWSSNTLNKSRLLLADDTTFENLILDTLVETNSFLYERKLTPNTVYYWTVKVDTLSKTTSFTIEDIISQYEGIYLVEVTKSCYEQAPPCDTIYYSTIELIKNNDKIKLIESSSYLNDTHCFNPNLGNLEELVYYADYCSVGSQDDSYLILNVETDTLRAVNSIIGLGGSVIWNFIGIKQ